MTNKHKKLTEPSGGPKKTDEYDTSSDGVDQSSDPKAVVVKEHGKSGKPTPQKEINGPKGLEPTRYGDWESKGRCYDF